MSVYNKDGELLNTLYALPGTQCGKVYDVDGNAKYVKGFVVMTYNVGSWYDGKHDIVPADKDADYYALQKEIIERYNPDVLFINEYTKQFSYAGRTAVSLLVELGFGFIYEVGGDTETTTRGRCIASKYPLTDYIERDFTDGGYYYDSCVINANGIPVNLVITHLHWDDRDKRTSEMQTIMSVLAGFQTFILCGDFNTTDNYDVDGADYVAIIKPLIDAGYNVANGGAFGFKVTYSSFPDNSWTACLDNIVTSPNIEITEVEVDETKLHDDITTERVDHLPLIATLQI